MIIFKLIYSDVDSNYDYVINCTGLGARDLCGDMNVYPIRGHVLRVSFIADELKI
jgi:D-aspartate oxidase